MTLINIPTVGIALITIQVDFRRNAGNWLFAGKIKAECTKSGITLWAANFLRKEKVLPEVRFDYGYDKIRETDCRCRQSSSMKQEDVVRELAKRLSMQEAGEAVEVNDYSVRR